MICGKLKSGFEYKIEEHRLDNMELLDVIAEVDSDPTKLPKLLNLLMDEDQRKSLYDHLRTEKGNVPVLAVSEAVAEIFKGSNKVKN